MSREKYNTEQSALVLEAIRGFDGNFEIKQIEEVLKDRVGAATIYRQIKKLSDEGKVKKQLIGETNYYCYIGDCDNEKHFNLLCRSCGKMQHTDCDCLENFRKEIAKDHGFEIDNDHLIISGYCKECKNEQ
jgi:Fur family ferric uptake transcriptional regulator